jgi:hypothetical protein
LVIVLVTILFTRENADVTTLKLGDIILEGMNEFGHFDQVWNMSSCDMQISFTYDANGLVDDENAQAWSLFGVRQVGTFDFNPLDGAGVWAVADFEWFTNTFAPDPIGVPGYDIDDRIIIQNTLGKGEDGYNLPVPPPNSWANYAIWFDRDDVSPTQAQLWGYIDGITYNTGGIYQVIIDLKKTSSSMGEAYLTINGESQGFYDPEWHPGPPDLSPAGLTFSGDLSQMQVFYFLTGFGASQHVEFKDITVTGCLASE